MSRTTSVTSAFVFFCAAIAGTAYAQQPPDVVTSDGSQNTAMGSEALQNLTTGGADNTASGWGTLSLNTTGGGNTASGAGALNANTTGDFNTATGVSTLVANTTGYYNSAFGPFAMYYNTTGFNNTAAGIFALEANTTGNNNIAVGYEAGQSLATGSNNIDIGNPGGSSTESATIRIGSLGTHTAAYIQGIHGTVVTGSAVYVKADGQLGVHASSERYKTDIATMGTSTEKLSQLRPVTFRLKAEPNGQLQYGLIAEEVAKVYPELVIREEDGRIEGVRYEELAPMLLNEVQQQKKEISDQKASIVSQERELQDIRQQLAEVNELKKQLAELKELNQAAKASQVKLQAAKGPADRL